MKTLMSYLVKSLLPVVAALFISTQALAEIVVIVNPGSGVSSLTRSEVKALYLGKSKSLKPFDQAKGSKIREKFIDKVVGKSESQFKAYWSKKIFSGKGTPPKVLGSNSAVKSRVAGSVGAIGFIDSSAVDSSVKVVYRVK
jgi:ABC-type phosphate transport system substrate-binding protein